MKLLKHFSPFFLILIISVITFRFLFFISYIDSQKENFRNKVFTENNESVLFLKISNDDVFLNKNSFEWKENNKELVINGVYHEVISIKKYKDHSVVSVIEDKAENSLFKKFFCMNKGIHKDLSDLIKLLLNLTYLQSIPEIDFEQKADKIKFFPATIQFSDFQFYLRSIKPPQA